MSNPLWNNLGHVKRATPLPDVIAGWLGIHKAFEVNSFIGTVTPMAHILQIVVG